MLKWTELSKNNSYCKDAKKLSSNLKNTTKSLASLRYTLFKGLYKQIKCGYLFELPEIIGHYLNLNLKYVEPNQNFNGSLGWYNGTHLSGPIKMLADNQVDYIINEISNDFITEDTWNSNLFQLTTGLKDDYRIGFAFKKKTHKISILDYFKVFGPLFWLLIFCSIIVVSITQTLIKYLTFNSIFNFRFFLRISWEYFSLIQSKSSILLRKFKPFHYVMYFIPLLSVLIISLFNVELYSSMVSPRKYWCQDLDCFIKSYQGFYTLNTTICKDAMAKRKKWQFEKILLRLNVIKPHGKFNMFVNYLTIHEFIL